MARGRMIAATVADDKRFNELPIDAALVYLMAIPQLDRDGLILGEPGALWGQVCRRRNDLLSRMEAIITAWLISGLVTAFKNADGDTILHFTGFHKNQAITHYDREAASRFPCPPGFCRTSKGLVLEQVQQTDKTSADEVRTNSGLTPDEVPPNVNQSNVNESIGELPNDSSTQELQDEKQLAIAVVAKMEAHGIGVTPFTVETYLDAAKEFGIHAVLLGITAAAEQGKQHRMKYVQACIESKAQGKLPTGMVTPANGVVNGFDYSTLTGGA
jgi:hypothetical protein